MEQRATALASPFSIHTTASLCYQKMPYFSLGVTAKHRPPEAKTFTPDLRAGAVMTVCVCLRVCFCSFRLLNFKQDALSHNKPYSLTTFLLPSLPIAPQAL